MNKRGRVIGTAILLIVSLFFINFFVANLDFTTQTKIGSLSEVIVDPTIEQLFSNPQENLITGNAIGVQEGKVSVIISLREDSETQTENLMDRVEAIKEKQEEVLSDLKLEEQGGFLGVTEQPELKLKQQYTTINAIAGEITKEGLEKLKENSNVERIDFNNPITFSLDHSISLINADDVNSLNYDGVNINGAGETVCVIDTGVDYTHPALGSCTPEEFLNGSCEKVISGYDFGDGDDDPKDVHGHGTHVAGIVASGDSKYQGVAPGAKIVAMKVFTDSGSGNTAYALAAIDWCVYNASKFNISAITMSIGVTNNYGEEIPYLTTCDANDPLAAKSSWAASQGIFVDASAGNSKGALGVTAPACGENVTSVGSVTQSGQISGFNTAPILGVLAPGSSIKSTILSNKFGTKSGTSMAAPHVAGTALLLQQFSKHINNATLTPAEIKSILQSTGKSVYDNRNELNFSLVDVYQATISLDSTIPRINFVEPTPADSSEENSSFLINITSNEHLDQAILEWDDNLNLTNQSMLGGGTNFYLTKTNLSNGTYNYRVYGYDLANNLNTTEYRIIDFIVYPESNQSENNTENVTDNVTIITFNLPINNSYYNEDFNLNITLSDGDLLSVIGFNITNISGNLIQNNTFSNLTYNHFILNDSVSLVDGVYTLLVFATDSFNNSVREEVQFTVDRATPFLSAITRDPGIVYNEDLVIFTVDVSDNNLENSAVLFSSNFSGAWVNYSMKFESNNTYNYSFEGNSNLSNQEVVGYRFYATDLAGNVGVSELFVFTVQNRLPIINITAPDDNIVVEVGAETQFTTITSDSDGDSLTYLWDFGDSTTSTEQNPTHTYSSTGTFTVNVEVSDSYGSVSGNIVVVANESIGPEISTVYDSEVHLERDGTMSLGVTVSDYSGISDLAVLFDNITFPTDSYCEDTNSNTRECSWTITFESEDVGVHQINVSASDNSNNENSGSYAVTFTSCSDSSKNGDETETDCGGSCSACASSNSDSSGSSSSGGSGGGGGGGSGGGSGGSSSSGGTTTVTSATVTEPVVDTPTEEIEEEPEAELVEEIVEVQETLGANEPQTEEAVESKAGMFSSITGAFSVDTISDLGTQGLVLVGIISLIVILSGVYLVIRIKNY
jgi:subtilisin family serine protease